MVRRGLHYPITDGRVAVHGITSEFKIIRVARLALVGVGNWQVYICHAVGPIQDEFHLPLMGL